jgi:hypothetical protein
MSPKAAAATRWAPVESEATEPQPLKAVGDVGVVHVTPEFVDVEIPNPEEPSPGTARRTVPVAFEATAFAMPAPPTLVQVWLASVETQAPPRRLNGGIVTVLPAIR